MLFRNLHTVEEGKVYRTGKLPVKTFEKIADRLEIKTLFRVICLHRGNREYFDKLDAACKKKGIRYFDAGLKHNDIPDKPKLRKLLDIFDKAEYPMLIMCWRGADRSGLTSALYQMHAGRSREEVFDELKFFPYGHLWFLHPRYHVFLKNLYDQFGGDLQKYLESDVGLSKNNA